MGRWQRGKRPRRSHKEFATETPEERLLRDADKGMFVRTALLSAVLLVIAVRLIADRTLPTVVLGLGLLVLAPVPTLRVWSDRPWAPSGTDN